MDQDQIYRRFTHHPPSSDDVVAAHAETRVRCHDLALWLNDVILDCPELERAMDALDDVCKHANAAIARTQLGLPGYVPAPTPSFSEVMPPSTD